MILITGASGSIGKFLFEKYSKKGEIVCGTYYSSLENFDNHLFKVDISNHNDVNNWILSLDKIQDVTLINCAGISYNSFAHKADPLEWKKVIDVNVYGTFNCIRYLLPIMREQKYGRIINLSSVVPQKPTPGVSAYSASKAALWGLTKSIAAEVGTLNITINNINLGYVNLGMGIEKVPLSYQEEIKKQIPNGRFCDPIDIYTTVEYLRETSYINGASIDLNGGLI